MSKIKTAATCLAIMLSCFAGFLLIGYYMAPDDMLQNTENATSEVFQIENQSFSDVSAITYADPMVINVSAPVAEKKAVSAEKSVKKSSVLKAMSTKISEFCLKAFPPATTAPVQETVTEATETTTVTEAIEEVTEVTEVVVEETETIVIPEVVIEENAQPVTDSVIVAKPLSYLQPVETVSAEVFAEPVIIETTPVAVETTVIETVPVVYEEVFEEVYVEPVYEEYTEPVYSNYYVSDSDFVLLCNAVAHEAGSDWIDVYSKANVVEVIMNRVNSPLYPNTVYGVLSQPYQFEGSGFYVNMTSYSYEVTDSVIQAVNLYFNEPYSFMHGYFSFFGDGVQNYFS